MENYFYHPAWRKYMRELQKEYGLTDRQVMYGAVERQGSDATKLEEIEDMDLFVLIENIIRYKEMKMDIEWLEEAIHDPLYQKFPMTKMVDTFEQFPITEDNVYKV
jgi:hypothetical protein